MKLIIFSAYVHYINYIVPDDTLTLGITIKINWVRRLLQSDWPVFKERGTGSY